MSPLFRTLPFLVLVFVCLMPYLVVDAKPSNVFLALQPARLDGSSFLQFKDDNRFDLNPNTEPKLSPTNSGPKSVLPPIPVDIDIPRAWVPKQCEPKNVANSARVKSPATQDEMRNFRWSSSEASDLQKRMCFVRTYYVSILLKHCASKHLSVFSSVLVYALGSDSYTSDLDLSIMGQQANQVLRCFVEGFQQVWGANSALVFDTNLYADQLFVDSDLKYPEKLPCPCYQKELREDTSGLGTSKDVYSMSRAIMGNREANANAIADEHVASLAKLIIYSSHDMRALDMTVGMMKLEMQNMGQTTDLSGRALTELMSAVAKAKTWVGEALVDFTTEESDYINQFGQEVVTRRYANYMSLIDKAAKKMENMRGSAVVPSKCVELKKDLMKANALAMEAYFTQGALEEVVLAGQAGERMTVTVANYIDAFTENVGDTLKMLHHQHVANGNEAIFFTHKYAFRFFKELAQITSVFKVYRSLFESSVTGLDFSASFKATFFEPGFTDLIKTLYDNYFKVKALKTSLTSATAVFGHRDWPALVEKLDGAWGGVQRHMNPGEPVLRVSGANNGGNSATLITQLVRFILLRYAEAALPEFNMKFEMLIPAHSVANEHYLRAQKVDMLAGYFSALEKKKSAVGDEAERAAGVEYDKFIAGLPPLLSTMSAEEYAAVLSYLTTDKEKLEFQSLISSQDKEKTSAFVRNVMAKSQKQKPTHRIVPT